MRELESPSFSNLGQRFLEVARERKAHPAFVQETCETTFQDLSSAAQTIATTLAKQQGWSVGDRVALDLSNSPAYAAAFYGILLAGGTVVPLAPDMDVCRKQSILDSAGCRLVISGDPQTLIPTVSTRTIQVSCEMPTPPQDLAAIFFTSGSTGIPKGVMLSHSNLLVNAASIQQYLRIQVTDRTLALLPFFHAFGNSVLQTHLLAGATLVIAGSMTYPETVSAALHQYRITSFSGVPDFFRLLLKHSRLGQIPLPQLRYVSVAGGSLQADMIGMLSGRIAPAELFVMYGQTEATARLSYLPPELLASKPGSIGCGIPGVILEVVDESGHRVSSGAIGEIRGKGANIMQGYWNDHPGTQAVLRDGWLYTGDLGTVDEEGFIYPRGRANTLFKIAGYRVHPMDVETVVARCFPGTEVIAVPFETASCGTRLAIFLTVLEAGLQIDVKSVRAACMAELARYLLPSHIEVLEHWPVNSACKVDRIALVARAVAANRL